MNELQLFFQSHFTLLSVVEILVLTFLIFQIFKLVSGTQAEKVIRGLILILLLVPISEFFGLTTLNFLIRNIFTWIFLLIIIVFQPELRTALERIGNSNIFGLSLLRNREIDNIEKTINTLVDAVQVLASTKTGALIVCEAKTGLKNIESTGTIIDGKISSTLLSNLFYNKAPLHDGAVIVSIDQDQVKAAGCVLPLTQNQEVPNQYGMRHRAGLGISEQSDALTIIVSEETGEISYSLNSSFYPDVTLEELKLALLDKYVEPLMRSEE